MEENELNDNKVTNLLKKIPLWLVIFLISAINFVSFDTWPNEENNFTMARHFLNPDWIPNSFSLQQWPGTNFIYWFIAGTGLKFLSFGQLAFFARLINYLLYAFPLAKIFKELKVSPIIALLILQIFFFKQEYMAGEWIWKGFEGKTIAYFLIFWSFYYLLKSAYYKVAIFAAIATYCHVLVGGWYFVGIGLFLLISRNKFIDTLKVSLVYLLITLPFIVYLGNFVLSGDSVESDPSANWIYVFYRNMHHLVPTLKNHFWQNDWPFITIMFLSLGLLFKRWFQHELHHKISLLLVAYNIILLSGIALTYLDKDGSILKFYVLRMSSISLLLELILITLFITEKVQIGAHLKLPTTIIQVSALTLMVYFGFQKNLKEWEVTPQEAAYLEFVEYVKSNSKATDKFCFINYKDKRENVRFIADAERDRLVSYKMVPEGDNAILEWYERIQERDQLSEDVSGFIQLASRYQLNYLVSKIPIENNASFKLLFSNSIYHVYQLRN